MSASGLKLGQSAAGACSETAEGLNEAAASARLLKYVRVVLIYLFSDCFGNGLVLVSRALLGSTVPHSPYHPHRPSLLLPQRPIWPLPSIASSTSTRKAMLR